MPVISGRSWNLYYGISSMSENGATVRSETDGDERQAMLQILSCRQISSDITFPF
jgi:hypothetical protein